MPPFNIREFNSNIDQFGVAKQSHFDVIINTTPIVGIRNFDAAPTMGDQLRLRCEAAEFPGLQVATMDAKIYGPLQKVAYAGMYTDVSFSFIMSNNMREKRFFEEWMNSIIGNRSSDRGSSNGLNSFNIGYHKNYSTDIVIRQFAPAPESHMQKAVYECRLYDAFPTTVAPISLNRGTDDVHRLNVVLTYRHWETVNMWKDGQLAVGHNPSNWFTRNAGLLGTIAGVVAARLPPNSARNIGTPGKVPDLISFLK